MTMEYVNNDKATAIVLIDPHSEVEVIDARLNILFFFFFQAEDGIRDYKVTGVQTCALPISASCISATWPSSASSCCLLSATAPGVRFSSQPRPSIGHVSGARRFRATSRSEERRVGKECRSRWSPYH